ncbi:hypothetical protein SAMN05216474_0324 [Lishizhenia tianjinensis]|uniref:Acyl carrier protein n=1 Tax=Lishizhenia tianjinensis TaxID=477690 RepID=A0A1I6XPA3_9FLAO|nr:hypothetical protein [Lishizhenia tianjinensis]SFT39624.1 hypothetical protein SAMN05216474_0324 [Lishizhenia tianjinensis]
MGLDSVDLLVSIEKTFNVEFSDYEAAHIHTIEEMVNALGAKITLSTVDSKVYDQISQHLKAEINSFLSCEIALKPQSLLGDIFQTEVFTTMWNDFRSQSSLKLPKPSKKEKYAHSRWKDFKFYTQRPIPDLNSSSFETLVAWTYSLNWKKFITIQEISALYDVKRILCGIINEQIGMDIKEIQLTDSFTSDLGIY